jgi:RNA polymerase sigma-70 factor (ECF subfamily)
LASFRTWFYRVVVNLCLSRRRRVPFLPLDAVPDPIDPAPQPGADLERRQTDQLVSAAIGTLPDRQRAAIALTYGQELSNAETAAILETSVSSVEALLVRAKRTLRDKLADVLP